MKHVAKKVISVIVCLAIGVSLSPDGARAQGEYRIGGGDSLQITVWKNAELSQSVVVRPDGQISLPLVRDVKAEGLTALELGKALAEKFSSFINAPNVTVTVAVATSYRVYTQGAIANGMFTLAAPVTARQLLARAGGAAPDADLSRAYLLQGDQRIPTDLSIDARGRETAGPAFILAPGDILVIPSREVTLGRVLVVGEVAQPHALPFQEGMTILDAFLGAGGGTPVADLKNTKIARLQGQNEILEIPVDLDAIVRGGALQANIVLAPGDIVIVPFRPPEERVLIVGEVRSPRAIAYRAGLTLLDVFVDGGGGTEFADLDSLKVVRSGPDGKKQEISVDLERILKRADLAQNVLLKPGDVVVVPR